MSYKVQYVIGPYSGEYVMLRMRERFPTLCALLHRDGEIFLFSPKCLDKK